MDAHVIAAAGLTAAVKADGAELCSLKDDTGTEYLWQAGPVWPRHAPVLFPIVGRLKDDTLKHNDRSYTLGQHGFARDRQFDWTERTGDACTLLLTDDPGTRAMYPFAFSFALRYQLSGHGLDITYTVTNTGTERLPASMGAHPAFNWPLDPNIPKENYSLTFSDEELKPLRGVAGGLLTAANKPSPVVHKRLALSPELFARDALVFEAPNSRHVTFSAPGSRWLQVAWEGFPQLGVWSRVGGDFLCIEPWAGMASPESFDGEFADKPWLMLIEPDESRSGKIRISTGPG